ncbi:MAG TPA: hypothetical protein PK253_01345 [Spirochaetota bacterium]|nr:hypothetical protein [Spirochaetota bacterium]
MKKSDLLQWILSFGTFLTGYTITFHSPCASGSIGVFIIFAASALLFSPILNSYIPGIKRSSTGVTLQITAGVLSFILALFITYPHCRGIHIPLIQENARISYYEQGGSGGYGNNAGIEDRAGVIEEDNEAGESTGVESSQIETVRDDEVSSERTAAEEGTGRSSEPVSGRTMERTSSGSSVLERIAYNGDAARTVGGRNISSNITKEVAGTGAGSTGTALNKGTAAHDMKQASGREYAVSAQQRTNAGSVRTDLKKETRALPNGSRYSGTTFRSAPEGSGVMKWPDGSTYSGEWKNGKRNGTGTMKWSGISSQRVTGDGGTMPLMSLWGYDRRGDAASAVVAYSGTWKDDKPFRKGAFRWSNNDYYRGSFSNAQRHGYGVYHYSHGTEYRGQWRNNKAHGKGSIAWKNGDRYSGGWSNDRREGTGTYIWSRGIRYNGSWHNDMMHGTGVITWKNGNRYAGQWKNNHREGKGVYTWKKGDRYEGVFVDDKRNGSGVYVWADGREYTGQWKNGLMEGSGQLKYPDGKVLQGTFRNNNYIGK